MNDVPCAVLCWTQVWHLGHGNEVVDGGVSVYTDAEEVFVRFGCSLHFQFRNPLCYRCRAGFYNAL
jgi:hypothetical protein